MDRDGFNYLDQHYQQDLEAQREKITNKWNIFYAQKTYVGPPSFFEQHKKAEELAKNLKIASELSAFEKRLDFNHFGETGRQAALDALNEKEQRTQENRNRLKQNILDIQQQKNNNEIKR